MSDFNLDRLRKKAKLLLKQCRAGDSAAIERIRMHLTRLSTLDAERLAQQIKLADIHHALARERGYANWAELNSHDAPLERFLAAIRSGDLQAAQRELRNFPEFAEESIHAACAIGDVDAVRYHLDRDPQLLHAEHDGWPPIIHICASRLHQASPRHAAGILDCAALLLDRGADPNASTLSDPADPHSALPALARSRFTGNQQLSSLLLECGATEPDLKRRPAAASRPMAKIPLDQALCRPDIDDLRDEVRRRLQPFKSRMYQRSARPKRPDEIHESSVGGLFLMDAEFRKIMIELAELHVKRGIDPNLACDREGGTLLHEFARVRNYPTSMLAIEWLLNHGADPNLKRNDGLTPFVLAVRSGNSDAVDAMLAHGADIDSTTPVDELIGACRNRDEQAAAEILGRAPDTLKRMGRHPHELLVNAAAADRIADIQFMAQLGFDLGSLGENGATALHLASWRGQVEIVRLLLELGAPVNVRDAAFGTSPLAWAAQASRHSQNTGDYCQVVEALLDAGADYASSVNRWGVGPEKISSARVADLLLARGRL
jgi:ankyrin repeat protein